jgi:hypothetical protein
MFVNKPNNFNLYVYNLQYPELLPASMLRFANNTLRFQFGVDKTFELVNRCIEEGIVLRVNKNNKFNE